MALHRSRGHELASSTRAASRPLSLVLAAILRPPAARRGNAAESFARRFELTGDADLILVETFILVDGGGRRVTDLLGERVRTW